MIALDTSALSRWFGGLDDWSTRIVRSALDACTAYLPPVVLAEVLSNEQLRDEDRSLLIRLPLLELHDGYWTRAGDLRAGLLSLTLKAKLADTLIAQSCIDHDLPLITYDRDFRHFLRAGLKLIQQES